MRSSARNREGTDRLCVTVRTVLGNNLVRLHYRNQHVGIPVTDSSTYTCKEESRYESEGNNTQDPPVATIQSVNSRDEED
jgi:hypothetical protein